MVCWGRSNVFGFTSRILLLSISFLYLFPGADAAIEVQLDKLRVSKSTVRFGAFKGARIECVNNKLSTPLKEDSFVKIHWRYWEDEFLEEWIGVGGVSRCWRNGTEVQIKMGIENVEEKWHVFQKACWKMWVVVVGMEGIALEEWILVM